MGDDSHRLVPDCRVSVEGQPLDTATDAALTRVIVDLDVDLFGQCSLVFNDPKLLLINGKTFASGAAVKVEIGFAAKLSKVFEGEVVALEPAFRRDQPPSLRVVCQEGLHRLALTTMTRAFNDVDTKELASKIAQEHGLSAEAPAGTKEHVLQANITDAVFLRRIAQSHGNNLRIEGKKLIIGPPPKGADVAVAPGDGLIRIKVKMDTRQQVGEVTVHGWDPKTKKEIVGKAQPEGETGAGAKKYGSGKSVSFSGHQPQARDVATAEAMAKGRLRRLAEGFVVAQGEMIGDPRVVPGAVLQIDKLGAGVDGGFRIDRAVHRFSKHGYHIDFRATRVAKKASSQASQKAAQQQAQQQAQAAAEQDAAAKPRASGQQQADSRDVQAQAQVMRDAAQDGTPFCEECEKAREDIEQQKKAAAA